MFTPSSVTVAPSAMETFTSSPNVPVSVCPSWITVSVVTPARSTIGYACTAEELIH